jgi:hypothetical protein
MDADGTVPFPSGGIVSDTAAKGARISGSARDELRADVSEKYLKGNSIRDLAVEIGRSYGFVHRLLVEAEVPLRGRGGAPKSRKQKSD